MSQVSILAIDVSQGADSIGVSNSNTSSEQSKNSDFSQIMAQQQQDKSGKTGHQSGKEQNYLATNKREPEVKNESSTDKDTATASQNSETDASASNETLEQGGTQAPVDDSASDTLEHLTKPVSEQQKQQNEDIAAKLLSFLKAADEVSTEHFEAAPVVDKQTVSSVANGVLTEKATGDALTDAAVKDSKTAISSDEKSLVDGAKVSDNQAAVTTKVATDKAASDKENLSRVEGDKAAANNNIDAETNVKNQSQEQINTPENKQGGAVKSGELKSEELVPKSEVKGSSTQASDLESRTQENKNALPAQDKAVNVQNYGGAEAVKKVEPTTQAVELKPASDAISDDMPMTDSGVAIAPKPVEKPESGAKTDDKAKPVQAQSKGVDISLHNGNETSNKEANTAQELAVNVVSVEQKNVQSKAADVSNERVVNQATATVSLAGKQESQQQNSNEQQSNHQAQQGAEQLNVEKNVKVTQTPDIENVVKETVLRSTLGEVTAQQANQHALSMAEEHAAQQVMQKANADSISVQSAKTAINIHNETIAIYRKDFSNAVKDKVMVMINQKIRQLDIRLDPPELGSMQVRLNLQNEQAAVNFVVQNQQAKEALEQNMHKLKDMLADSGVDVGDTNIEQRGQQSETKDGFAGQQASNGSLANEGELSDDTLMVSGTNLYKASATGVDYYA